MANITRVIAANGTSIDFASPEEIDNLNSQITNMQITPDHLQGFSAPVMDILTAQSQQAIRNAAGIMPDEIAVQGPPGETPEFTISNGAFQTKLPSQSTWTPLFTLASLEGSDGTNGINGVGIQSVDVAYQTGSSGVTVPSGQWTSATISALQGSFLWTRITLNLTDGAASTAYLASYSAVDGQPGSAGSNGVDGKDGSPGSRGVDGESPMIQVANGYVQTKLPSETSWTNLISVMTLTGHDGSNGSDGVGVASIITTYQQYSSGTSVPTGLWISSVPSVDKGSYLWTRIVITLSNGSSSTSYSVAYQSQDGAQGNPGVNATTTSNATTNSSGLMSAADKSKLDGLNNASVTVVASGARTMGTGFIVNANRPAFCTYTFTYALTATLTLGQNVQVVVTVGGAEVARIADGILLGLAGTLQKTKSVSFVAPANSTVLFTKTGTAAITVTVVSGEEVLL